MTDIDTLAARIRGGLDQRQQAADRQRSELWWIGSGARIDVYDSRGVQVGDIGIHGEDGPGSTRTVTVTEAVQRALLAGSPLTQEQLVDRDRRLLDLLLAEPHGRTPWLCESEAGDPCDCGRDARVAAYLAVLAKAYEETT